MGAYMSRGRGVLLRLRIEHRLSLEELARLLASSDEDFDGQEQPPIGAVRSAVAEVLTRSGTDALADVADALSSGDLDEARLSWCRNQVARAYAADCARFPDELARFKEQV